MRKGTVAASLRPFLSFFLPARVRAPVRFARPSVRLPPRFPCLEPASKGGTGGVLCGVRVSERIVPVRPLLHVWTANGKVFAVPVPICGRKQCVPKWGKGKGVQTTTAASQHC